MLERPRTVSLIGWGWLIFGSLLFLRSLLDLVIWKVLAPATPSLVAFLDEHEPQNQLVRPLFESLATIKIGEAVFAALVVLIASQFLRLRPWARRALQAACGVVLLYVLAFAAFWSWLWPRVAAERARHPDVPHGLSTLGLVAGLVICLALAAFLGKMIVVMSSARVRAAFDEGTHQG